MNLSLFSHTFSRLTLESEKMTRLSAKTTTKLVFIHTQYIEYMIERFLSGEEVFLSLSFFTHGNQQQPI